MIERLAGASIWSADLNNLLPFYRDTLGLKPSIEGTGFVVLGDLNGATLGLGTHSEVRGKNAEPARHMIAFETDDVHAEYQRLKDKGVEFVEEPTAFEHVTVATFEDPEGNYVQILQATD